MDECGKSQPQTKRPLCRRSALRHSGLFATYRRKHCLLALRTVKLPFQSSRVIFLGRSPAEEHLPGIIQAKECMKKKKHISEEQHYLCEIGLEKMPYGSSWLYNSLMIGHVGVMLPTSDAVYFVEKVAFQEPYRLLKFKNRTELSDYLMLKYDNSWGQDTAHTFIMENSDLMDGWRILDEQENAS